MCSCRSSLPNVFLGKGILKICNKFTEYPCRSVISIKLQSNVIEIALRHGCPPVNLLWKWGVKETPSTFFLQSCDSWMSVKENPDSKKRISTLREKCPNKEFFWSVFFRTRAEYGDLFRIYSVFSSSTGKYGSEKLRIWILFAQCQSRISIKHQFFLAK